MPSHASGAGPRSFRLLFWKACGWLSASWVLSLPAQTNANALAPAATNAAALRLVQRAEALEQYSLTFGLDRVAFLRQERFLDEPLWKYAAFGLYLLLAFCLVRALDWGLRLGLEKRVRSAGLPPGGLGLLDLLRGPLKLLGFMVLVCVGLNFLDWSLQTRLYLFRTLVLAVAGALTYLLIKLVNALLAFWRRHSSSGADSAFDDQLFWVLRIGLNAFVVVVAVLVTAQNMDINITAAVASLSIGGLAVGLAAQDTLGNLFGAVAVFVDKPFQVGERIKLDVAEGVVESVGLRSTRVRSSEGHLVSVPNKTIGSASISNLSRRQGIQTTMNLSLSAALPASQVRRALTLLEAAYRQHPRTAQVLVSFNQFSGASLNIQVIHRWRGSDYPLYLADLQEMNLKVKEQLEAEQIHFG